MATAIGIADKWSDQDLAVWYDAGNGLWLIERSHMPYFNFAGSLRPHPRMQPGYYLFPASFNPNEAA